MRRIFTYSAILAMALCLLLFPHLSAIAVQKALKLCADAIIPSLYPYMILTNLWFSLGGSQWLGEKLRPCMRSVFHLPGEAASALLLGCVSGFPIGAKITAMLYDDHQIEKNTAEHMLLFCSNAGPAFIFGVIGKYVFKDLRISTALWLIHVASALVLGILFRPQFSPIQGQNQPSPDTGGKSKRPSVQAIIDAGRSVIQICMFIIFFSIITEFLTAVAPASWRASSIYPFFIGFLELSNGVSAFPQQPTGTAFIMLSALLAWNGCCIHLQVLSITSGSQLKTKKYFAGKLLHTLLSTAISCAAIPLLPLQTPFLSGFRPVFFFIPVTLSMILLFCAVTKTSSGKSLKHRL